eukprot:jgi/Ulvmu1/3579/UM168_0011.1
MRTMGAACMRHMHLQRRLKPRLAGCLHRLQLLPAIGENMMLPPARSKQSVLRRLARIKLHPPLRCANQSTLRMLPNLSHSTPRPLLPPAHSTPCLLPSIVPNPQHLLRRAARSTQSLLQRPASHDLRLMLLHLHASRIQ